MTIAGTPIPEPVDSSSRSTLATLQSSGVGSFRQHPGCPAGNSHQASAKRPKGAHMDVGGLALDPRQEVGGLTQAVTASVDQSMPLPTASDSGPRLHLGR